MSISSGLFVPMLLIGSIVGRILGLCAVDLTHVADSFSIISAAAQWKWIDPGVFAVIGAAAFLAGVTRISISVPVIMMEVSTASRTPLCCYYRRFEHLCCLDALTPVLPFSKLNIYFWDTLIQKRSFNLMKIYNFRVDLTYFEALVDSVRLVVYHVPYDHYVFKLASIHTHRIADDSSNLVFCSVSGPEKQM